MKIYHYTTIENLALILQCQTIRFSRLDAVDDLEEGLVESSGVHPGRYVFVSCWTENCEESIPLWKMYTKDCIGVRIGLERDMFLEYVSRGEDISMPEGSKAIGQITSKIPATEVFNPDGKYMVLPLFSDEFFYRKIEYVESVADKTNNAVKYDGKTLSIAFKDIGCYKHKRWSFQEESRFKLVILPRNPNISVTDPMFSSYLTQAIANNIILPIEYYDMHLKPEVFDNMEIICSPSMNQAQKTIVNSLINQFAPKATVLDSSLASLLRLK